uniref:Phosphatidylinositol-4-phosphate 3-kinase catalytic subunit type 2 alpha n=1 Tax=Scleropages formosus TaxID=113540 RepID=A0A8C9T4C5_SCLFO
MAQISSGNGFKPDMSSSLGAGQSKGIVGKEEALRMEAEALAKLQKEKRHTLPASSSAAKPLSSETQRASSTGRLEKDLIVFPEADAKKRAENDKFRDIDVDKLTTEELEKLLLDDSFGANSKAARPSSLLGCNLSASFPGSQPFNTAPFHCGPWTPSLGSHTGSALSTPTHQQAPVFSSTPFSKPPGSFQNGLTTGMPLFRASEPLFLGLQAQPRFVAFPPLQPPAPIIFQQPAVTPEMAKLFDKIASTSEYLKNGKSASADLESASTKSIAPKHPAAEAPSISRFEWLDLDPLSKRKADCDETPVAALGRVTAEVVPAGDPWDAVLLDDSDRGAASSPPTQGRSQLSARRASAGTAVTRSHSVNIPAASVQPGPTPLLICVMFLYCRLRSKFPHDDLVTNPGYVLSPVIPQRDMNGDSSIGVKVSIEISDSQEPVTFTCDVSSPVELLIMQALCWAHDDLNQVDIGSYLLKICGQEAVLQNKHSLGSHEYVQNCRKWETEIKLQLLSQSTIRKDLARTVEDDTSSIALEKYLHLVERPFKETLCYHLMKDHAIYYLLKGTQYKTIENVIQIVKNICCVLDEVETMAITEAVKKVKRSVNLPRSKAGTKSSENSANGHTNPVEESLAGLNTAVYDLVKLYLRSFCPTSLRQAETPPTERRGSKEASGTTDHLQFTLFAVHGITNMWVSCYEKYYLMCALIHNGRNLFKPVQSKKVGTYKSFFYHIKWDELIHFPISVALLPLESMLSLALYGIPNQNVSSSPDSNKQRKGPELLGKVAMPLFDFKRATLCAPPPPLLYCSWFNFFPLFYKHSIKSSVWSKIVHELRGLAPVDPGCFLSRLTRADRQLLWDKRHHCRMYKQSLPKVLASAPSWDWGSMAEIHGLLHHWLPLSPVSALELLDAKFADTEVRSVAVSWIEGSSDDELLDYLPQLVQALKFECHLKNALVMFLFSRALENINIAHYLYWLLRDAVQDPCFGARYENVLGALLCLCGAKLRSELDKQAHLTQLLGTLAEKVRQANGSTRQAVLQEGLGVVQSFFQKSSCRLPLSPSLVAKGLNVKACSFFNSNAVPLKLALVNADPLGEEINVMFKVGEDLRQDMLALQMIRIMDRIWLQEGLDLRIVNFKCISTGKDKGMVELVPASDTLRKIQVEYGVTGSFKDKPLAEWLRKYNPAEEEYEKASENFIYSCAGCCVATYVLGICDRHNDNIMLRSTGHMFHIDFGKFLGHAQMFGSFKRDRAPFVLTSDMAYVINGGERPTSRFQLFVDLCCQAYNLIRKHASLFLNLLSLMMSSGLPELTGPQDLKYVYDALQPETTDAEATIFFTRLIESSLGSVATKFNFFIHNLAQLRFSGLPSNDEPILSFSPKTYTMKQDGRIRDASIFTFQKRYNPEKHYTYVVRVLREGQSEPQFVFRTFDEFQELHNKLTILFPLWKLPNFPNKMVLGRTHIKEVAAKRKVELNNYVHNLMRSSTEVTQCDLVYTFFHPNARDDKTEGFDKVTPMSPISGRVEGEVKLSVSYRNGNLFIMVMHIKDLVWEDGSDPNPYVKTYLLPDPHKTSKRKTKISRKTRNPTFNEMLVYSNYSKESLSQRELQLSVLSAESLRENCYLGGVTLSLKDFDLSKETVKWYKLTAVPYF